MPILLLQHHDIETPGRLGETLRNLGHRLDIRRPDRDGANALPTDLAGLNGVVVMGGPQNVDGAGRSAAPWLDAEIDLVRQAHEAQLPVVGVCLGAQVIAHALGGTVEPMQTPEVGFAPVRLTVPGQINPIMAGIAWESPQFHVHGQQVMKLPDGATLLASSDACVNQAFKVGLRTYGFQFHFECDRAMIEAIYAQCRDLFDLAGVTRTGLAEQAARDEAMYVRTSERLCETITRLAFPFVSKWSA
jgi:GMP synthase (glutamine-hydrolysing)